MVTGDQELQKEGNVKAEKAAWKDGRLGRTSLALSHNTTGSVFAVSSKGIDALSETPMHGLRIPTSGQVSLRIMKLVTAPRTPTRTETSQMRVSAQDLFVYRDGEQGGGTSRTENCRPWIGRLGSSLSLVSGLSSGTG